MAEFNILDHLDQLESDGGKNTATELSYQCPSCGSSNFKVNKKTGEWSTFGCDCGATEEGKRKIREAINPAINPNKQYKKQIRPKNTRHWNYYTEVTLLDNRPAIKYRRIDDGKGNKDNTQLSQIPGVKAGEIRPKLLPYGIKTLREKINDIDHIFIVEGESCVDALTQVGLTAITFNGGCKGYISERDGNIIPKEHRHKIVIAPDADALGIEYGDEIFADYPEASWLYAIPNNPAWSNPPENGGLDIADWIELGATKDQIIDSIRKERLAAAEPQGAAKAAPIVFDAKYIKEKLEEIYNDGLTKADLATALAALADQTEKQLSYIEKLYKSVREANEEEVELADINSALDEVNSANALLASIKMQDYLPEKYCYPLRVIQKGIPYPDIVLLMDLLTLASSVVKLGTNVVGCEYQDWEHPMNLFVATVGPSGAKKTPKKKALFDKPTELIKEEIARLNERRLAEWENQCAAKSKGPKPTAPKLLHVQIDDYTSEALTDLLSALEKYGQPLLIIRDELKALFDSFNKYQGGKSGGDEEQLLELYDGGSYTSVRVNSSRTYRQSHVSLHGGIQDRVLRNLVNSGDDNGKWARFIFVPLPELKAVLGEVFIDDERIREKQRADEDLKNLVEDLWCAPARKYVLNVDARRKLMEYQYFTETQRQESKQPAVKALKNKSAGKALRIAGLLQALQSAADKSHNTIVTAETFDKASALVETLDQWTLAFYASAVITDGPLSSENEKQRLLRRIHNVARKHKGYVSWTTIRRALRPDDRKGINATMAQELLQELADAEIGKVGKGKRGGITYRALENYPDVQ